MINLNSVIRLCADLGEEITSYLEIKRTSLELLCKQINRRPIFNIATKQSDFMKRLMRHRDQRKVSSFIS